MPSPVGHALVGFTVGALVSGRPVPRPESARGSVAHVLKDTAWGRALLFAGLACAPDLDLLVGAHSMYTHSVGATVLVGLVALALRWPWSLVAGCMLAYATHPLLDWLTNDGTPPLGIMALWPFSDAYHLAPHPVLPGVSRRYWLPEFWSHNLRVVRNELLIGGTVALGAYALRWRRATGTRR